MNPAKTTHRLYRVQAVDRALDILDCFNFQTRELSLPEITQATGLNKTTAKRLMSNLAHRGYLHQDPATKSYRLGLRLFELGGIVFSSFSLRQAAAPSMNRLQKETGATVLLGMMMEDQLLYVDKREGYGVIRISSDIGWRRPAHYGMLGPVLLAFMDPKEVERLLAKDPLQRHTPFSITDENAFTLRLEKIRKDGYFVERQEAVEGVMGISGPIRDFSRKVVAAMGIVVMMARSQNKRTVEQHIKIVKETCAEASSALGCGKI
ncbi:MAG: IclR family transcriptional regulator [Deltaproteobacteria bacterium]|nr:IclR family transcriptional regulator [Deltaproteobacteria bacterium]